MPPETDDQTTEDRGLSFTEDFVQQITEEAARREAQSTGSTTESAGGVSISPSTDSSTPGDNEEGDEPAEDSADAPDELGDEADADTGTSGPADEGGAAGTPDQTPEAAATPPAGPSQEDVAAGQQLLAWFRGLPPEAMHGIDLYLSGQYILVPRDQAPTLPQVNQPVAQVPDDNDDDEDFLDPRAKREIERLRAEVQSIRQTEQQTIAQQQAAQEQEYLRIGQQVTESFAQEHNLSDADIQKVMAVTANLGIINGLMQQTGGDYAAALARAYETATYADPELRTKILTTTATPPPAPQVDVDANAHAAMVERRKRAGAVSSGGGSTPRTAPPPKDRTTAMAEELAAAMGRPS